MAIEAGQRHFSQDTIGQVRVFHDAFGVPVQSQPGFPASDRVDLRLALLREELREVEAAILAGDLLQVLRELVDIQYVLDGTFLEFGLGHLKLAAFAEVHRANMSKLGEDGRPVLRHDGKVLKGPNFRAPEFEPLLAEGTPAQ